jgi:uncharacterized protein YbcC (UPF0753/DUF2309 family)
MRLGKKLWIRSLVNLAAEVIPFFWSMRTFIHHNPLYEMESKPFKDAVEEGRRIFGGEPFLPRETYAELLKKGLLEARFLREGISRFLEETGYSGSVDLEEALFRLLTENPELRPYRNLYLTEPELRPPRGVTEAFLEDPKEVCEGLIRSVGRERTLYDLIDSLTGSRLGQRLNDLVIKSSFEFLDEGQSAVGMPGRERGFFRAWLELARRDLRTKLRVSYCVLEDLCRVEDPEEAIHLVLKDLGIPEDLWENYLTLELAKLKGIVGFIRWRSQNREYYWQRIYPVDVVEFTAVRLVLARGLMENLKGKIPFSPDYPSLKEFLKRECGRAYLMWEYFSGEGLPDLADQLPERFSRPEGFLEEYLVRKASATARSWTVFLKRWLEPMGYRPEAMSSEELLELINLYREFERREGLLWLEALEETLTERIVEGILRGGPSEKKEVIADVVFCIDVRSERLRRNLERIGPYRTFGMAGFFGVPMAFVEVSKGHEEFLCPVLIKPRNVVLELPVEGRRREGLLHLTERIIHDLKENLITPYITVEAIGLLFGLDFLGKTFLPGLYSPIRSKIGDRRGKTKVLVDKLSEEEIERVLKTVLSTMVRRLLERELGKDHVPEELVQEVRDYLLEEGGRPNVPPEVLERLKRHYGIDRGYRDILREKLKRIGFSHEEQATLVAKALQSLGLTEGFAPVVLLIGHESRSDNNPYESALDCGACGGASGLHNARVFCEMANNPAVREILKKRHGIRIPQDTVFIPGVHNTTTDEVTLYDLEKVPGKLYPLLERIREDLGRAGRMSASERAEELGGGGDPSLVKIYAHDWSQVRPEWGLSGNYAFVIGRRELTQHLNLRGKVFLHSYDYRKDPKGFLLETILSGPLIVGEWINMEHYFSTTDNEVYGSGSKVYHNVVGRFGVVSGNFSDLRTGLPYQTVLRKEGPHHLPVRLIVLIEAPFELARSVVERVYKVRELLQNGWVNMIVLDPERGVLYRFREGSWRRYREALEEVKHGQA